MVAYSIHRFLFAYSHETKAIFINAYNTVRGAGVIQRGVIPIARTDASNIARKSLPLIWAADNTLL